MTIKKFLIPLISGWIVAATFAQIPVEQRFKQWDKNGDGKITPEELGMATVFKAADKNGDGAISPDEFAAYMNSRRAGKQSGAPTKSQAAESVKHADIRYAETPGVEANAQSLDIYAPKGAKGAPVMMYVHGGGWQGGDKRSLAAALPFFNGQGFIFVSINYRLLPSGKHPNNVADVARAIAWVHDHIAQYGGNPSQLFLYGHSAGAHLVALVATDERHLKAAGKNLFVLKGVIPLDTNAYDIPKLTADKGEGNIYIAAFGPDPAVQKDASPIAHVARGKGIPPMLVFHSNSGTGSRNEQGKAFVAALKAAGVDAELIPSMKQNHGEINRQFGTPGDMVTEAAMKFINRYRTGAKSADAPSSPAPTSATLPSGKTMHEWVKAYAALGEHRAASDVDLKTSEWLATQLRAAGLKVKFQEFTVPQFQLKEVRLTVGGSAVTAFPAWPARATMGTISAPLVLADASTLKGRVVLLDANRTRRRESGATLQKLAQDGAVAVLQVVSSEDGGIHAVNVSDPEAAPVSIPVLRVGSNQRDALHKAAARGETAALSVAGEWQPQAKARNVIATLERGPRHIVISTPYSGWFRCGGERGSGLAVFIALAHWAAKQDPQVSFTFVANSAHELGYAGMKAFLETHAPKKENVICWLHLGANVALLPEARPAEGNRPTRLFTTRPEWEASLTKAFQNVPWVRVATDRQPTGELSLVAPKGYPSLNLAGGGNRWMHSPGDGPETTSPAVLEPLAFALAASLELIKNALPAPQSNIPAPLNLQFTKDYVPGTRDVNGKWMGGTEALNMAVHNNRLYAGIGYWQDIPLYEDKPGDPWVGAQILVKEGKDTPWKVDLNMGERVLRARALRTVTFETDAQGNRLPQPVEILLTSGMNFGSPEILSWSRDDDSNQWHRTVVDRTKVGDYIVAFGGHRDRTTGVSCVFGGSRNGSVYRGVHDPGVPGKVRWENQPEFTTRDERDDTKNAERRVMGFAEADGALYASIRTSIYRRADGGKPDWKEVYRWPLPPADDEGWRRPEGRGLTAVPKPDGKGQMLLVALEMEQVIRRIDPANGHRAEDDFNVGAYFLKAWGHEVRSSLCMAHNRIVPYTIPSTGENVLMFGFIANPRGAPPWNRSGGAGLFVRRADGSYQHFPVEDPSLNPHPVLYATRDVAPSPWEPNVIYVCGYDATGNAALKTRALNTAWIWRGEFQQNKSKD